MAMPQQPTEEATSVRSTSRTTQPEPQIRCQNSISGGPAAGGSASGPGGGRGSSAVVASHARGLRRSMSVLRSEEHTSELQSQSNLVCRLLLEKKKKKKKKINI